MTSIEFFSLLSAVSLFAIAIALVPTFLQFRRTLHKMEICFDNLNKNIDPLCLSLTEAANEIQILSISLSDKIEKTDKVIFTAQKSAETLLTTANMLKDTARPFITHLGGFSVGLMTFSHFLNRFWKKHKQGE